MKITKFDTIQLTPMGVTWHEAIYGLASPGAQELNKGGPYDVLGSAYKTGCIHRESDPVVQAHKLFRPLIEKSKDKRIDFAHWLELVAFDTWEKRLLGRDLGVLRKEQERHSWTDLVLSDLFKAALVDNLRRVEIVVAIGGRQLPSLTLSRLETSALPQDFPTHLAKEVRSGEVSQEEMTAHSSLTLRKRDISGLHFGRRILPCKELSGDGKASERYSHPAKVRISSWTVTYDLTSFHESKTFEPEWWLDPDRRDIKHVGQPFLLGHRACIGRR
ncbi:hypothetical protein F5Y05DRAFT_415758 [Hypoxylon sp. FL0543]|nr:hypothetical protein F5Y05DRAFT_415758 [Hypoxylon sp. FL0543]